MFFKTTLSFQNASDDSIKLKNEIAIFFTTKIKKITIIQFEKRFASYNGTKC